MDILKNFLYASLGLASMAAEKIQTVINDLVDKGKISDEEGKRIVKEFFDNAESRKDELESKLRKIMEGLIERFDFIPRKDFQKLEERIKLLEEKLGIVYEENAEPSDEPQAPPQ